MTLDFQHDFTVNTVCVGKTPEDLTDFKQGQVWVWIYNDQIQDFFVVVDAAIKEKFNFKCDRLTYLELTFLSSTTGKISIYRIQQALIRDYKDIQLVGDI